MMRFLVLLFIVMGFYGQAQGKPATAITVEGDTIVFTYPKNYLDKFELERGLRGYLPNGERIKITLKKHKQFTIDTLVFKVIKHVFGSELFMEEEVSGRINLYTHRIMSTFTNTPMARPVVHYYLLKENGGTVRILKWELRKTPEIYFREHPGVLKYLTGTRKDYDNLPKLIAKYNREDP